VTVSIEHGDCREVVKRLAAEGVTVDAICTDPPYHLTATVKRFAKERLNGNTDIAKRARKESGKALDDGLARLAGGFMGQQWDGGDVAFDPETWRTLATILRPGGFLLAFGGTRTSHRMVCAIEDAGFVIQDTIMWLYASGFPKRKDMLKPAFEPICLAYKPGGNRTLQVDECRIPGGASPAVERRLSARRNNHAPGRPGEYGYTITNRITPQAYCADHPGEKLGRWPANVIHDGSDEVMEAFAEYDAPGQFAAVKGSEPSNSARYIYGGLAGRHAPREPVGDRGSPARFFYCAKADKQDRWGSRHPTVKPVELIRYLVKLVCPAGGTILDPFAGSGTAGVAALAEGRSAILIEQDATYIADIRERMAHYEGNGRHSLVAKNRNRGGGIGALRDGSRWDAAVNRKRIGTLL
jgi:site-specific DNA-methyltransferase (adenine-specific)